VDLHGLASNIELVGLLVHELGHVFGLKDLPTPSCPISNTVMVSTGDKIKGLTSFDRQEVIGRFGAHGGNTSLVRRTYAGSTWGPAVSLPMASPVVGGPGLGASYVYSSLRVPIPEDPGTAGGGDERVQGMSFFHTENWGASWYHAISPPIQNPTAIAIATNGTAIKAYVYQSDPASISFQICYQKSSDGGTSFGAAVCYSNPACSPNNVPRGRQNTASATYDPLAGRFLVAFTCAQSGTSYGTAYILSTPRPGVSGSDFGTTVYGPGVDGVGIACADTQPIDAPLYSNCRMAYVRQVYPYAIESREFGTDNFGIYFGSSYTSTMVSEHAPALAWHADRFHMAFSVDDTNIYYSSMSRGGTTWAPQTLLNSAGWVSPPMLSPTKSGTSKKLHVFWMSYESLP